MPNSRFATSICVLGTVLLGACATTQMDAQWSNPDFKGRSLKGQTVLVACQAREFTLQRVCEDQMSAQLTQAGARVIRLPANDPSASATNDALLAAAKRGGAVALARTSLNSSVPVVTNSGPQIGIGVGGVGGGGGGRYGGVGGGISFPIGGAQATEAFAAETTITDVANGVLVWSGRASTPTGSDTTTQLSDLARVTGEALLKAGIL
jgi:hypothetical protein